MNHWNKVERPSVYIENGHVAARTLAAIDVEKEQDQGGDGHGSKVLVIPLPWRGFGSRPAAHEVVRHTMCEKCAYGL